MSDEVIYRYIARDDGAFVSGLPQRDLTASDVAAVSAWDVRTGVAAGLYQPVKEPPPAADEAADEPVVENERRARR